MQRSRLFFSLSLSLALGFVGCAGNPGALDGRDDAALANTRTVTFQRGAAPSASYAGASDTTLVQSTPSTAAGSAGEFSVDGDDPNGTRLDDNLLLRFDVSSIPAGSTVSAASLTLYVTNNSVQSYPLYELTHAWTEATATWSTSGSGAWSAAGATGSADHGATVVGTLTATQTGVTTVSLNASGVALVQKWVRTPSSNHGFVALATSNYDKASFASSEASTASQRPALSVSYVAPVVPDGASCFPFADPSPATLRASQHKVFAHYFSPYPLSLDNVAPSSDYYAAHYLSDGFNATYGGLLRDRPLPQAPRTEPNWEVLNLEEEVRRAIALGLDGFVYDILNLTPGTRHWDTLVNLLAAANAVDPGFKIVLMPDMNAGWATSNPTGIVAAVKSIASAPALYRDASGAIVMSAFYADHQTESWWNTQLEALASQGVKVSFIPLFLNEGTNGYQLVTEFSPISFGMAEWGAAFASAAPGLGTHVDYLRSKGKTSLFPVTPQSFRPDQLTYWEASNSQTLQQDFQSAISHDADWVQLVTWNDYSESTQISPSLYTDWAYYDLAAYYLRWMKAGSAPAIEKDALYYFHRASLTTLKPSKQTSSYRVPAGPAPTNNVELVAFLTAAGTLEIAQGSSVQQKAVGAGLQSFTVALQAGQTPVFRLLRNGATVLQVTSNTPVKTNLAYQDLAYHGGTSVSCQRILR